MKNIREGLIPTVLGSAVTATGYAMKQKIGTNKMIANTIFGFRCSWREQTLGQLPRGARCRPLPSNFGCHQPC